jgi:hypothetical protein
MHSPSYLCPMVIKPYVDREARDPRRSAGRRAERQMAHYLDRPFHDRKKLYVLHDVRIEHDGEVDQMDHLVVHGCGVTIVESKSVSTSVRISFQGTLANMALDMFAAISDDGTARRAKTGQAPRAMKVDAIPKAIEDLVASYRRDTSILSPNLRAVAKAPRDVNDAGLLRIGHFLRMRSTEAPAEPVVVCKACGEQLRLVAGAHGFDGRCRACDRGYEVRFGSARVGRCDGP